MGIGDIKADSSSLLRFGVESWCAFYGGNGGGYALQSAGWLWIMGCGAGNC